MKNNDICKVIKKRYTTHNIDNVINIVTEPKLYSLKNRHINLRK